jgi:hypothetical protein
LLSADTRFNILKGEDIKFHDVGTIHQYTLEEILEHGMDDYNMKLSILCITSLEIDEMFDFGLEERIYPFQFIYSNCMGSNDDGVREMILGAFELLFKEPVGVCDYGYFYIGELSQERYIWEVNFSELIEIVKMCNCIQDKDIVVPKNDKQKEFMKRRRKINQLKAKREKSKDPMFDVVSSVSAKHHTYNLGNIWDLTICQIMDQYKRLCTIEDYELTIQGMMHGAGSNSKLKHWSQSID